MRARHQGNLKTSEPQGQSPSEPQQNLRVRALNIFLAPRNIPTKQFGNDFIAMDGGTRIGDPCEAKGHHGYHGIEKETVAAIKKWIKQGS